jgi:dinuclear metal center YbgI/SA1388 family protein
MIVQDIINKLEELAPLAYAEEFDNVGLLVGDKNSKVSGVLITLDTLPEVVDEAIAENCNLIVSFHPIIFKGLKSITGNSYVERVVQKAIKNEISIFAIHTALDNALGGVNAELCNRLGLKNKYILIPQSGTIKKLTTFVPKTDAEALRSALFEAGGGAIGNYENCSFSSEGIGTFKGNEASKPVIGKPHEFKQLGELKIEIVFAKHLESSILKSLFKAHPYEEVAYEISTLENKNQHIGMGMVGTLETAMHEDAFLEYVKEKMKCGVIRHSKLLNKEIKKVAVLGGSGSFAIAAAKAAGADAFVTSDLKYHDFFSAENKILVMDIGHYESEQYTKNLLAAFLTKKIPNFAVLLSKINTNPVKYK